MPQTWFDNTGLYQKYGTDQTIPMAGAEYKTFGELRTIEFKISLLPLTTTQTIVTGMDNVFLPAGVRIEQVEVIAETLATSGGSATLNVGLIRTDRTTNISATGIVNALALTAIDTAGEKNILTTAAGGALIGTTTANVSHFTANWGTAAYTAGVVVIRVKYYKP